MPTPRTAANTSNWKLQRQMLSIALVLVLTTCWLAVPSPAWAASAGIRVIVGGNVLEGATGQLVDGRTLVPLRGIFEALGAAVSWNGQEQSVSAQLGPRTVKIFIDTSKGYINGTLTDLDVPPTLIDNRTFVPVRFVSEALGATVTWDDASKTVFVTSPSEAPETPVPGEGDIEGVAQVGTQATVTVIGLSGIGSGFHIGNGRVVTNYHVVEGESSLTVQTAAGATHDVEGVLAYDTNRDLVVLSVPGMDIPALELSSSPVRLGQTVLAVGSPQGLSGTVSVGVVSTTSRQLDSQPFIQTTAALSPGNSGGPLLDLNGQVVGINAATLAAENTQNINFAIPVSALRVMLTDVSDSTEATPLASLPGLHMPIELLAAELQAAIEESLFTSADIYWDDAGQEVLFYLTVDTDGYATLLDELTSQTLSRSDLEDLLYSLAILIQGSQSSPVYGALWFWDVFDTYPQAFADQGYAVNKLDNGQWAVNELILSINLAMGAAPRYNWWPAP